MRTFARYKNIQAANFGVNSLPDPGRCFLSVRWRVFVNRLVGQLLINVPDVDPAVVIAVGATGLRQDFTETEFPGIVLPYMLALKFVYAFPIALAGTPTIIGTISSWKSINGSVVISIA